jgi:hypothetical protein
MAKRNSGVAPASTAAADAAVEKSGEAPATAEAVVAEGGEAGTAVAAAITAELSATWPQKVVLKNDTPFRFMESVTRTLLEANSDRTVSVSKDEFVRINNNFKQLNILNKCNGLQVICPLGVENA